MWAYSVVTLGKGQAAGNVSLRPDASQSAGTWQAELFDRLLREKPDEAFGTGPIQEVLWQKPVELAVRYAAIDGPALDVGCGNRVVAR